MGEMVLSPPKNSKLDLRQFLSGGNKPDHQALKEQRVAAPRFRFYYVEFYL
jgi:hypothetical protein